ncbi:MAG TPA: GNAT family N-acetyltransferase [Ktedonobacterales bacterium]|nr:GNAT family N-acetyltransferase [Ktedonobacterales bacterium]
MIELETERLRLREAHADDLPALLSVYLSNPAFVAMNEGSRGEQGHFDLEMFQRDWQIAQITPGRHMLGVWLKESEQAVGQADFMDENPDDGMPWLGLLMIASPFHRQGFGTEAFTRLAEHFRADRGWTALRLGVLPQNTPALAFWRHLGFASLGGAEEDMVGRNVIVLERQL